MSDPIDDRPPDERCCPDCGRDLWSVPLARYCPDCGAALGSPTARIPPDRAPRIATALLVVEVGLALVAFFGVVNAVREFFIVMRQQGGRVNFITFGVPTDFHSLVGWLRIAAAAVWAVGWWRVAAVAGDHAPKAARSLRAFIAALAGVVVVIGLRRSAVTLQNLTPLDFTLMALNIACYAGVFFSAMVLSRRLAIDAAHPRLARYAVTLMWLLPLLATAGAFLLVGPLVAAGLWIAFLELLRRHIAGARGACE